MPPLRTVSLIAAAGALLSLALAPAPAAGQPVQARVAYGVFAARPAVAASGPAPAADPNLLRDAIGLARAEVAALKRLRAEYEPFTRFKVGAPLPVTVAQLELDLHAAELRRRRLEAELATNWRWQAAYSRRRQTAGPRVSAGH